MCVNFVLDFYFCKLDLFPNVCLERAEQKPLLHSSQIKVVLTEKVRAVFAARNRGAHTSAPRLTPRRYPTPHIAPSNFRSLQDPSSRSGGRARRMRLSILPHLIPLQVHPSSGPSSSNPNGCSHQYWRGVDPLSRSPPLQASKIGRSATNRATVARRSSMYSRMSLRPHSSRASSRLGYLHSPASSWRRRCSLHIL